MKVNITVGFTKSGLQEYKYWNRKNLIGVDVDITDGKGNKITIGSREGGSLIKINDKTIQEIE